MGKVSVFTVVCSVIEAAGGGGWQVQDLGAAGEGTGPRWSPATARGMGTGYRGWYYFVTIMGGCLVR